MFFKNRGRSGNLSLVTKTKSNTYENLSIPSNGKSGYSVSSSCGLGSVVIILFLNILLKLVALSLIHLLQCVGIF